MTTLVSSLFTTMIIKLQNFFFILVKEIKNEALGEIAHLWNVYMSCIGLNYNFISLAKASRLICEL